ncbi:OmpA family protein [Luteibacter jiangsuensis]|uniref:OmpA family protein n=1 Tax=Luteibacter jiangsuensis TaxID=637577 RepID=A0ABX0Q8X6_9GAMM|nr:OmpA family protein [Luteibacter jiangsuensis]NID06380.1 OmpA family protein [Luteibacter jiangsuensis]
MRATFKGVAALSLALALAGCGNYSHEVAKDGRSAGQLAWPSPTNMPSMHKGGTFPNLDNLRQVRSGLDKHQIAELIGYPHFEEGVWGVREWNYVFNFRKPGNDEVTVCQYKILFDKDKLARSFYWMPEACSALAEEPRPEPAPIAAAPAPSPQNITLSADALFAFDSAGLTDGGKEAVTNLGAKLREHIAQTQSIRVTGYTDRLGSDAYNQQLSERRARAVMEALVSDGVPRTKIVAEGLGEKDPIKDCPDGPRKELVTCLAPNRRVEIRVD